MNNVFGFYLSTDAINYTALISEEESLQLGTNNTTRVYIGNGMQIGTPTGGDMGAGTINLETGCYINGVSCAGSGMSTNGSNATSVAQQAIATAAAGADLSIGGTVLVAGNASLTPSTAWMEGQFPNTAAVSQLTGIATSTAGGYGVAGGCETGLPGNVSGANCFGVGGFSWGNGGASTIANGSFGQAKASGAGTAIGDEHDIINLGGPNPLQTPYAYTFPLTAGYWMGSRRSRPAGMERDRQHRWDDPDHHGCRRQPHRHRRSDRMVGQHG